MIMAEPSGQLSHTDTFQHSVPIRLAAYWVLAFGALLFVALGLYPLAPRPILLITVLESAVLGVTYRRALTSERVALGYLAFEGICQTLIFHFCGDLRLGVAPVVYTFELLNPGVRLNTRGHAAVANGFAAMFGLLVVAQHWILGLELRAAWPAASVLLVFLELNVAAFFVSQLRHVLEDRALALTYAHDALRTESAALEQRVAERTSELERSFRALRDQADDHRTFVYSVTHDLKAPLTAIQLRAERLRERAGADLACESRGDLERIISLAERGESMLHDLMAHFEVSEHVEAPTMVDLEMTVRRAFEPHESAAVAKGLHVRFGKLPIVWGQSQKLVHVFANLLGNAVRFAPDHGQIDVDAQEDNHGATVCVRDNGPGIPAGYEETIFDFFTRAPNPTGDTPPTNGSTGLGLAIARRIVKQHRGTVWVESVSGQGACFYVHLPAGPP